MLMLRGGEEGGKAGDGRMKRSVFPRFAAALSRAVCATKTLPLPDTKRSIKFQFKCDGGSPPSLHLLHSHPQRGFSLLLPVCHIGRAVTASLGVFVFPLLRAPISNLFIHGPGFRGRAPLRQILPGNLEQRPPQRKLAQRLASLFVSLLPLWS